MYHNKWHPATDYLAGTQAYGIPFNYQNNWSIKFSHMNFDQFLFTSGDRSKWLIADKDQVIGGFYSGVKKTIVKSSDRSTPIARSWYRRSGVSEDPWISIEDHGNCLSTSNYCIVYGEGNYNGGHGRSYNSYHYMATHGGAKVYIRLKGASNGANCMKPPVEEDCQWVSRC
jgi:hypothetical protein